LNPSELEILKYITIFDLGLIGFYGTMYIYTNRKVWLVGVGIFTILTLINIVNLIGGHHGSKSVFKGEILSSQHSSVELGYTRPCCLSPEQQESKNDDSIYTQKQRKDSIYRKGKNWEYRLDPNPNKGLPILDTCRPCP